MIDENQVAMSFDEIGKREGITRGAAHQIYCTAIRKLKRKPAALAAIHALGMKEEA